MFKKYLAIVAFTFSVLTAPAVFANSWGCGEGFKTMLEGLNLTDEQKTKIKPVVEQLKSTIKTNAEQFKDLNTQIHQQEMSATMDQSTVDGLVDKKAQLIGNMMKAKVTAHNQVFAILTADQKAKIQDMMQKVEDKMAEKFKSCHDDD